MPFYATRPSDEQARRVQDASRGVPSGVPSDLRGATGDDARLEGARSLGFAVDRIGVAIGAGEDVFERARAKLDAWAQYPPSFTDVIHDGAPPRDGDVIVARIRTLGFWSLNPCLIVASTSGPRDRAFAIQTLAGHAECGEERFWLRWDDDDRVRYGITALSRPHAMLARLGAPIVRAYQRRFQRESVHAMESFVHEPAGRLASLRGSTDVRRHGLLRGRHGHASLRASFCRMDSVAPQTISPSIS